MKRIVLLILLSTFWSISTVSANDNDKTPSGLHYAELKKEVDRYVSDYIGTSTTGAQVVILKENTILVNTSYGFANIENEEKITAETVFEWGSVTKLLVWTSVMQLVEQGKLQLDEDIRTYLPKGFLDNLQYETPITLLHLMHHNAGWEDRYIDLFYQSTNQLRPLHEMLQIVKPNQVHEPGSVVAYSNFGVSLAAFIVEQITHQSFDEYVHQNIFSVLNMQNTAIHPAQQDHPSIATKRANIYGYAGNEGNLTKSIYERSFIGLYPSGSAIGTIEDITKFMMALMPSNSKKSQLFDSHETLEKMLTTSDFYDNGQPRNAHGFWIGLYGINTLGHSGNSESFSSQFLFSKEHQLGLIVMTNQKNEVALTYGLPTLLFGEYASADKTQSFTPLHKQKEHYYWARQPYKGFGKLYGMLNTVPIEVIDETSLKAFGITYKQIQPSLYQSLDGTNDLLHITAQDGMIKKVSTTTSDLLPITLNLHFLKVFSLIALIYSILWTVILLTIRIIQIWKREINIVPFKLLTNIEPLLLIANLVLFINNTLLFYNAFNYTPYANLRIHFWLNITYLIFALFSILILSLNLKNTKNTRKQKIYNMLSCCSTVLLIVLIFTWELYF